MKTKEKLMSIKMWLHWLLISAIVLGVLQIWQGGQMWSIKNVLISTPLIMLGDLASEFILKLFGINVD